MADSNPKTNSAVMTRLLSAIVLAPVVLAAIHLGSPYFDGLVGVAALLMAWEWSRMCAGASKRVAWMVVGVVYVLTPCLALLWLRGGSGNGPNSGYETVFWLFILVWAADSGAYAFGRLIGGPKLAPSISPKKTWSGFIGGILCAGAVGAVTATMLGKGAVFQLSVVSIALGGVAQAGDLLESWLKRHFGLKDTGNIIPGHGGILDRVDGLMAVAVLTALIQWTGKGSILSWL